MLKPTHAASALIALLGAACAMPSHPGADDFVRYEHQFRQRAADEYAALDAQRASGELSAQQYESAKQQLDARVVADAHDALYRHHQLAGPRQQERHSGASTSIRGASR